MSGILIVNDVIPRDLRRALEREGREKDISLNDVAGRVMAAHFGVEWQDSGEPFRKPRSDRFRFKVPQEMHTQIAMEARHRLATIRGFVLGELAAHFDCKPIATGRRPRGGK